MNTGRSHWATVPLLVGIISLLHLAAHAAMVTTDKLDYAPGSTAIITGTGFTPNSTVTLQVLHDDGHPSDGEDHDPWSVDADEHGDFITTWFVCTDDCVGALLRVTAMDTNGVIASATFTDSQQLGSGQVISVVPTGGACIDGPNGNSVQSWEVVQGATYLVTLSNVVDCATDGTDPTIVVMLKNSDSGNFCVTATNQGVGIYVFAVTMPLNSCNGFPITYCVTGCSPNSGSFARRNDGDDFQVHFQAGIFTNCNYVGIDSDCTAVSCPPNIVTNCVNPSTNGPGAYVSWPVAPGFTYTPAPGSFFAHGTTNTVIGTNAAGASCTFTVTVLDNCDEFCVCAFSFVNCPTNTSVQCLSQVTPPPTVTATDCLGSVTVNYLGQTESKPGSSCGNIITRVWQATDRCGNAHFCTNTISVNDTIPPVLVGVPTNQTFQCLSEVQPAPNVTATDNCDTNLVVEYVATTNGSCPTVITRSWRVVDACTNSASATRLITVNDTIPPVLVGVPTNQTFQCLSQVPPAPNVTATDNCHTNLVVEYSATTNGSCPTVITRSWRAVDACTNSASATRVITVNDTIPPVLVGVPTNQTFQCLSEVPPVPNVTATDNCDTNLVVEYSATTNGSCPTVITRSWRAVDACTNSASATRVITVNDTIPPVLVGVPTNQTFQCLSQVPPVPNVTATDNCDTNLVVEYSATTNGSCPTVITRSWRAVDACTNSASATRVITVNDTIPPTIQCPTNLTVQCLADVPPCPGTLTAFLALGGLAGDNCDSNLTYICSDSTLVGGICGGTIIRTHTVIDDCTNSASCTQTITVRDTIPPTITCPTNVTVQCLAGVPACPGSLAGFLSLGGAAAGDNCDTTLTYVCSDGPLVGGICGGTIIRTHTVIDDCTNSASCTQTITVRDTIPPTITCPTNVTVQCLAGVPACPGSLAGFLSLGGAAAGDNCDTTLTYVCSDGPLVGGICGGTIIRTHTVIDDCTNSASCTQTITVRDTIPPTITCPTNVTVQCLAGVPACPGSLAGFLSLGGAAAGDNCDTTLTYVCSDSPLIGGICGGTIIRTHTVIDDCTNSASCTQTITVRDTIPPTITCPTNVTVQCLGNVPACPGSLTGFLSLVGATAGDNCDTNLTYICSDSPLLGGICGGTIIRTHTVIDDCTNSASCTQTITVRDTIPPSITCPTNFTVECLDDVPSCPGNLTAFLALGGTAASDNCDTNLTYFCSDSPLVGGICGGTIIRTHTVIDDCTNSASCTQTITLHDTVPPTITCPTNLFTVGEPPAPDISGVTASDNCDTNLTVTWQGDVTNGTCPRIITRTYRATDACTNYAECRQTITVFCPSMVTDSSLCTLPATCRTNQPGFRLIFTHDPHNMPCYKLTASNPGQFYYNVFYVGTPGSSVTFNITLPYPFVTQGANPIHVYDGATATLNGDQACLTPGTTIFPSSQQVTLTNYSPQAIGSTYTLSVNVTVPASGFVYLNIHLDYGLKKTGGYTKDASNNAVDCSGAPILIPDLQNYTFAVSGAQSGSASVESCNVFKRNPGVGGLTHNSLTLNPVPGSKALLKDARGSVIVTGLSDEDGWYLLNYKHTGPAATFYVTVTLPGTKAQTRAVTLKANGYVQTDFSSP